MGYRKQYEQERELVLLYKEKTRLLEEMQRHNILHLEYQSQIQELHFYLLTGSLLTVNSITSCILSFFMTFNIGLVALSSILSLLVVPVFFKFRKWQNKELFISTKIINKSHRSPTILEGKLKNLDSEINKKAADIKKPSN